MTPFRSMREASQIHLAWIASDYLEAGGDPMALNCGRILYGEYMLMACAVKLLGYDLASRNVRKWISRNEKKLSDFDRYPPLDKKVQRKTAAVHFLVGLAVEYLSSSEGDPSKLLSGSKSKPQYEALAEALRACGWFEAVGRVRTWIRTQNLSQSVEPLKSNPPNV